jgi:PAS domain S-box-containing protein
VFDSDELQLPNRPYSLRHSTAAVARRNQWQTVSIDAPKYLEAVLHDTSSEQARIVTEAHYPYRVIYANHAWEELCGWSADEAIGQSGLSFMQGEATERIKVKRINSAVREGERLNIRVINYKKDGQPFLNHLQITPLRSGPLGEYTHMLGILEEEPLEDYTCKLRRA